MERDLHYFCRGYLFVDKERKIAKIKTAWKFLIFNYKEIFIMVRYDIYEEKVRGLYKTLEEAGYSL